MTETTQPDPQVVACPWCGAPAGKPCRDAASGGPVGAYCGARRDHAAARKPPDGRGYPRRAGSREPVPGAGLNADHLPFLARLIDVADQAGVSIVYCCLNADWSVMTSPELDDEAGAAFLAALGVGEVGEPEQNTSRTIRAGRQFTGDGVCLYVRPIPTEAAAGDAP